MQTSEGLRKELERLKLERKEAEEVKKLQKQINAEKFSQTKSGKIFNKIADFGDKLTKPKPKGSQKPTKKPVSISEIMKNLPQ